MKCIRLAHELGLGVGDPREIKIVGQPELVDHPWNVEGPFRKMTFAAKMQHKIYWGSLKKPIEWSLKTWLAPWAYLASFAIHDFYWYPFVGRGRVRPALDSDWGRLFRDFETIVPDKNGYKVLAELKTAA